MDKTLVRGAMLIALTVVLQSLRLFYTAAANGKHVFYRYAC